MADEVTRLPFSPKEDPTPPIERETNTMTQDELDHLRESCSFPSSFQIRLSEADETIVSTCPGEVAFYKATFHAGLCLPIHPIIRRIYTSTTSVLPSSFPMRGEVLSIQ